MSVVSDTANMMYSIVSMTPDDTHSPVLVHGYPTDLTTGKQAMQLLTRRAFRDATSDHYTLSTIDLNHIPILGYEWYEKIKTLKDMDKLFLNNHVLMYANADETCIELLRLQETSEWYYYKYVSQKRPVVRTIFALRSFEPMTSLDGMDIAGTTANDAMSPRTAASHGNSPTSASDNIPVPPPVLLDATYQAIRKRDGRVTSSPSTADAPLSSSSPPLSDGTSSPMSSIGRLLLPANIDAELKLKLKELRAALEESVIEIEQCIPATAYSTWSQ